MIVDASHVAPDAVIKCDVCIVGAGPAGITLAAELLRSGHDIIILESGGKRVHPRTQELCKGDVANAATHGRLDLYRERRFGGTTGVWGGRCAPFDSIDFEVRPHVPYSGWPIRRKDLDRYYARAHEYCDLGDYAYEASTAVLKPFKDMIGGFRSADVRTDQLWRFSLPTDFSKGAGPLLKRAANVRVYLHATCLAICMHENGEAVQHLVVASSPHKRFKVEAREYILAAGGLEVTRLLLVSDSTQKAGIGNDRGLVGRFYMSHASGDIGEIRFTPKSDRVVWNYEKTTDGVYCRRALTIAEAVQRRQRLLNFRAILNHPPAGDPRHRNGVLSLMYLAKRALVRKIPPEYSNALSAITPTRNIAAHCYNVLTDPLSVGRFSGMWLVKRVLARRKLPSVMCASPSDTYTLHCDAEQSPHPSNRVTLSDAIDSFGLRRLSVNWALQDIDIRSVMESCCVLSNALRASGCGTLLFEPEAMREHIRRTWTVGSHHLGTARMASAPNSGVVDENCRVFGVQNLFIASSAVFPTSGVANPTLTVVALSIRIADHLRDKLQVPLWQTELASSV